MAGIRVLVARRTTYSYPSPNLPASGSMLIPLALMVDTLGWKSGVLEVINYSQSISGTGATAVVIALNGAVGTDGRLADTQSQSYMADVSIAAGTAAVTTTPKLYQDELTAPIGHAVNVYLQLNSASAAASGQVELEVFLIGRDV